MSFPRSWVLLGITHYKATPTKTNCQSEKRRMYLEGDPDPYVLCTKTSHYPGSIIVRDVGAGMPGTRGCRDARHVITLSLESRSAAWVFTLEAWVGVCQRYKFRTLQTISRSPQTGSGLSFFCFGRP
eukprot:669370-Rhodomonas_salina.2